MKRFELLESGIQISKVADKLDKFDNMSKTIMKDLKKIATLADEIEKDAMPDVDILVKQTIVETLSQYIICPEVRENTSFLDLEDVKRTSTREIEVKREEGSVVYTVKENTHIGVGIANLSLYKYEDAVRIAKSRALIELEGYKLRGVYSKTNTIGAE